MTLAISIRHRLGAFTLDMSFASEGHLTALFGRSGAGKTSLVNVIAGLLHPDQGRVAVGDTVLLDTARRIDIPVHKRRIGYVFQEGRLFPHLTVRQNLRYGRWFAPRDGRSDDFDRVVGLLGIDALLDRRPARLSGGEKQRVAIGRALLSSPRLLLLDEPLAALDEARKEEILPYLERLRDETRIPIVYVSHSLAEVTRLATTVVVLSEGRVAAAGPMAEVMARADLFPLTGGAEAGAVLTAQVAGHDPDFDLTILHTRAGEVRVPRIALPIGAAIRLRVRARDVMIATQRPEGLSALNVLAATIVEIGAADGARIDLRLDCHGEALIAWLTRQSVATLGLVPGQSVYAVIKSVALD